MGRLLPIFPCVALQDELLKLIRAEIAERQWPDVECEAGNALVPFWASWGR